MLVMTEKRVVLDFTNFNPYMRFAVCMLRLQEKAGLTYKESRAYLSPYYESSSVLAEDFGISVEAIYNLVRRAKNKVAMTGMTEEEIFGEYSPRDIYFSPGRRDKSECKIDVSRRTVIESHEKLNE
jgi:DNA-binding CsgD family transcriptional regulator